MSKSRFQKPSWLSKELIVPGLVGVIIVAAFVMGTLYGKVSVYEKTGTTPPSPSQESEPVAQAPVEVSQELVASLFERDDVIRFGSADNKVLFVEFSDASCPYCQIATGKNPELNKEAGDRFTLVSDGGTYLAPVAEMKKMVDAGTASYAWLYSPGAGAGEVAAQAFYCAFEQDAFWPVHDALMSAEGFALLRESVGNDISKASLITDLVADAVNTTAFQACLDNGTYADRIERDTQLSRQFGVSGTPGFFVNQTNFAGAYSFADMQATVDAALE